MEYIVTIAFAIYHNFKQIRKLILIFHADPDTDPHRQDNLMICLPIYHNKCTEFVPQTQISQKPKNRKSERN